MTGMPTVPVYDLKIHPRDHELIAATHGRGFWIVDIAPLEQMAGDNGDEGRRGRGVPLRAEDGVRVRAGSGDGRVVEWRGTQGVRCAEPGVRGGDRVSRGRRRGAGRDGRGAQWRSIGLHRAVGIGGGQTFPTNRERGPRRHAASAERSGGRRVDEWREGRK